MDTIKQLIAGAWEFAKWVKDILSFIQPFVVAGGGFTIFNFYYPEIPLIPEPPIVKVLDQKVDSLKIQIDSLKAEISKQPVIPSKKTINHYIDQDSLLIGQDSILVMIQKLDACVDGHSADIKRQLRRIEAELESLK